MLVAVFILFIGIVGLVLYLVVQSYSRARSEQYDASSLVEEYANNRMITQQGDVVFCYRLLLPPAYSYTAEAYDQIVEIWRVALKDLPRGTIIMRSDRYDRSYFDASCMPEMSYIQREEKAYARSRLKTNGTSYLFIVYTGFRETRNPKSQNPFVTLSHKEFKEEDGAYSHFLNTLDSMYLQLQGSGLLDIRPLSEPEIREYMHYYFNGYQSDFLTDVYATKRYVRAGDNYVGAVSIEHERQFPEVLRTPYPGRGVKVPIGTLEDLGIGLPFPHICNQIITITGHDTEYAMIEATLKMLRKNRGFSDDAEDQRNRMETTRHNIGDNMEAMLVRGHTNIIYWGESEQQVKEYRTIVTNFLKQQRHFEPVVPTGVELRNVVYCSNPATVACMDSDAYYIADITQAIALFQNVGGYESDAEGVFFSDPVDHMPLRYDLYDANKKYADSRNIAVVGMTGGGKTVTLEKVVDAYHHDKTAEYINIIVDCGGSYDKAARLYDPEEVFTFRYSPSEALGLDPFAFGSSSEEERVDDICETLWLIIKPDAVPSAEERVSLRKIVMMYLHLPLESSWRGFYAWLSNNYAEILDGCQIRPEYFNINQFIHNGSEWCCGGVYENVLAQSDNPTARLKGKRLLIFELENIKAKPQLLSIVVHLIGIAIRTLVWEQPGKRGFIIYEEFAELMQMDMIFSAVLYQMQAIRKKDGSACIVLQNLDQLALNAGDRYKKEGGAAGALMKNIATTIFLAGADPTGFEKYAKRFSEHDRNCVLALENNYTDDPRYSSFYIFRQKKSTIMTLCVSPRTYLAFQTEGKICNELGKLYEDTQSMAAAIELYEKEH